MDVVNATINETIKNGSDAINGTTKEPPSTEGFMVAYASLFLMALFPIWFGASKSLSAILHQKSTGEEIETMTTKDAAMFPFIASGALFGIYIFFKEITPFRFTTKSVYEYPAYLNQITKIFSKEYINMLLTGYFVILGIMSLGKVLSPVVKSILPGCFPNCCYKLLLTKEPDEETTSTVATTTQTGDNVDTKKEEYLNVLFDRKIILAHLVSLGIGIWYLFTKHWISNNIFGIAFSINAVELLQLNSVTTGCILLSGLFIYDIFWVFGTDVMVTVAKSFEAPIKLVFPRDIVMKGIEKDSFAMLGLGDIVIPGIFIALLLRFDYRIFLLEDPRSAVMLLSNFSQNKGNRVYFITGFIAYIIGLLTTIVIMHVFKHAQPALLYLVPACLGAPIIVALVRGEMKELFSYEDNPSVTSGESESKKTE